MFSGIIQETGTIKKIELKNGILEILISLPDSINDIEVGDSIAIDGCCQTVVEINNNLLKIQATQETLAKTNFNKLQAGSKINIEHSLKIGGKLNGHLVSGHIDGTGKVIDILSFDDNKIIKILYPKELNNFIAQKGSIAVNGVSLTIIESQNSNFTFTLIPYTQNNTNLGLLKIGDLVNLEADLVSRYLVNYLENNNLATKN